MLTKPPHLVFFLWVPRVIVTLSLVLFLIAVSTRFTSSSVSDEHGFRQSQTALTTRYLMRGGPFLRYETPVIGYPWSIPFEFPLYQGTVAVLSGLLKTPMIPTARAVSIMSFCIVLAIGWQLLGEFQLAIQYRLVFLSLALVSPLYLFWSRAVLIETFGLVFALVYIYAATRFLRATFVNTSLPWFLIALGAGVIVAMVKITTLPSASMAVVLLGGGVILRRARQRESLTIVFIAVVVLLLIPVIAGGAWTRFADSVKSENPLSVQLTSGGLSTFNFGTPMNRLQSSVWGEIAFFNCWDILGGLPILFLPFLFFAVPSAQRRRQIAGCFLCYFIAPFLFMNLYRVHNYYACGSGLYLIAAMGWLIVGLLESHSGLRKSDWRLWSGTLTLVSCVVFCSSTYFLRFYGIQRNPIPYYPRAVAILRERCPPNCVIVGYGLYWSSELALYTDRRTVLSVYDNNGTSVQMYAALEKLKAARVPIGGVVLADEAHTLQKQTGSFNKQLVRLGMSPQPVYEEETCSVYIAVPRKSE